MTTDVFRLSVKATVSNRRRSCEVSINYVYTGNHGNLADRGSAQLIPYLFQFLVLLSREQPKLMSIPEVMQRCDQVLASGRNVSTYGEDHLSIM